ncbi:uncharacterized protein Z518_06003 [Rhinocladiella mackenziei CBS 650.93]|uniref:IQ calmodulin-binding motif domain protein n=1 Tax=Rhinocladiella mackenziei CBS 650.93 TaxID=1442369 RepID=A0A0D2IPP8_9EURO|nr:uncharacterized protein Z518_06003 [Rhinocladiella mackenziei CBS 650.93]KIX05131.1 hypothetical protein Z518_06003 [Rhinocladiella mackenziei CBS 650.93]
MEPTTPTNEDVDMMNLPNDNEPVYAEPPPRLAARFCRKSNTRRKSSANSSRRSSLSSIHSHSSALSSHGGPNTTHIAQHLRRASIIESRKARLADRAAHAEQVRLRAAAAKASQRVSYSEEKAIAAQAAREKLLAEITARCEEEVKRAKKIAEETREKKAAELARLKEEMAEKFAEAARRKSIYQQGIRRPRTTSLAAVEEKKILPTVLKRSNRVYAAKVIQRSWRRYRERKIMNAFGALELDLSRAKALSFEELTKLLSMEKTTEVTSSVLKHLGVLEDVQEDSGAVRVFLSAYLVLAHPMQALSHGGNQPQEQELMNKAASLVELFESYMTAVPREVMSSSSKDAMSFAFNDFTSTFHAWKSQDLGVLVDIMVSSFVNLDLILQATTHDHDGHVAEDYLDAVRQEQIKLLARLKRLAGPEEALSRVRVAVRKARKQRAADQRKKAAGQVPRASTPTSEGLSGAQGAPITPPASPRPDRRDQEPRALSFADSLGRIMTVLPSNREIAHEIQINGNFEVQQRPWTDARKDLMNSLRSGMRSSMQDGSTEAIARWTHAMAVLVREKLMNLISPRHPLYDRIDGFLDPALINQQCRNGMFSYDSFFETIAGLIAQICSPGRDENVRAFTANTASDTIDRLLELINIIDLMTLDHINFQFRLASRSVLERGHEHEIALFERDLQDGVHALERTKQWWANAKSHVTGPNTNGNVLYARGLADTVLGNSHLSYRNLPETLQLDYVRLLKLRARAFQMVATSSILLTTKIRLRRNRESLWTKDAERLMSLDLLTTDNSRVVSFIESSHMMPDSTKEGLSNFVERVLPPAIAAAQVADSAEQDRQDAIHSQSKYDPSDAESDGSNMGDVFTEQIATFLLKSLREHVFARLSAGGTAERVRTTTSAGEFLARVGMPEYLEEVNRLVDGLERIRSVDLKAHERWYDQIAAEVS